MIPRSFGVIRPDRRRQDVETLLSPKCVCSVRLDRAHFARQSCASSCWACGAVRLRAGRVVCLCSVRLDRAHFARQSCRHRGGAPARALCWRCACLRCLTAAAQGLPSELCREPAPPPSHKRTRGGVSPMDLHEGLLPPQTRSMESPTHAFLTPRRALSDDDQSSDVECRTGCPFTRGSVGVACQRHGRGAAWPSGRAPRARVAGIPRHAQGPRRAGANSWPRGNTWASWGAPPAPWTGAEQSTHPLRALHTADLDICYTCQGTSDPNP